MMGVRQFFGKLSAMFLERKSKKPLASFLQSATFLALFGLGLFIAYLRFTRTL